MSASERLKALADLDASTGIGHIKTCTALRAALPQIVAVVEAAERGRDQWDTPERYIGTAMADLRAALAALEEALS